MPRPVDVRRRRQLLEAAVDYVIEHGLSTLSLRPLAAALETDAPVLLHHFGSKENLLVQILNGVRDRLRHVAADTAGGPEQLRPVWEWAAAPEHEPLYRLFFEAYGIALRNPVAYREFLDHVVADWLAQLSPGMGDRATLAIAAVRGLLLDLLTTGDRARVDTAVRLLVRLLAADQRS